MLTYQPLSTEKLYIESLKQEVRDVRRDKNKAAVRSFFHFLFACGVILFTLFAIETMSVWLPPLTAYFGHELQQINGMLEAQNVTQ